MLVKMNILFRVDASLQIGNGHVMRCLTLADALRQEGASCTFVCREHEGNLLALIQHKGHNTLALPNSSANISLSATPARQEYLTWLGTIAQEDAWQTITALQALALDRPAWLIVDHYALDSEWESALRPYCQKIMVIDDLADRRHDCDLLLDQTFGRDERDYQPLVPEHCTILTGSCYALLRSEFAEWREYSLQRRQELQLKQLLITLGGVDKDNVTGKVLAALNDSDLPSDCHITIVMGKHAPWLDAVTTQAKQLPWSTEVKVDVSNMAELMANSDLCIGAAGSTTWERCCLGLPTIQFTIAINQEKIAEQLQSINVIVWLRKIAQLKDHIIFAHKHQKKLALGCATVCDGQGISRVVNKVFSIESEDLFLQLRPISNEDNLFLKSLQTLEIRKFFTNPQIPSEDEHRKWFSTISACAESLVLIIEYHSKKVGMLRVDNLHAQLPEISIIISTAHAGKGIGVSSLKTLAEIFKKQKLKAIIHNKNISSIRIFEKSGFRKSVNQDNFDEYILMP